LARIYGDPRRLAEEAVEPVRRESLRLLDEALQAAQRIVEEAISEEAEKASKELDQRYEQLRERLASVRARLELELRKAVEGEKNRYAEEAIRKAIEEFRARKRDMPEYREFMRRAIMRVAEEAGEGGEAVVRVAPEDRGLAEEIAGEVAPGVVKVDSEPADIIGGVIAFLRGGEVRLDLSLDRILAAEEARLRMAALRALFG